MDLESGPERRVRRPGARDSAESREVAKVRVRKGRDGGEEEGCWFWGGGRRGSRLVAQWEGNVSSSAITSVFGVRKEG
jgi:hypothetical protein